MRLDRRGAAALEFCLVAVPFFLLVFAIIDFGRYTITMQSLRMLADAGARAMMVNCYTPAVIAASATSPSGCTGDFLSAADKQAIAPFLYAGGLAPTLNVAPATVNGSNVLQVTAASPDFTMLIPSVWGTTFNAPSVSTSVPY